MIYNTKPSRKQYSEEEISEAIKEFQKEDGLIKILPDEVAPKNKTVYPKNIGNSQAYEDILTGYY